jgi:LAS superfamily LD-carboxypeptidase LdcB
MIEFIPVTMPADLTGQSNGKLGPCHTKAVYFPGLGYAGLHALAARAWEVMAVICLAETGVKLTTTGGGAYRSYEQQLSAFQTRMTLNFDPNVNRDPAITRKWNGQTWYLRKGYAPVAAPGTSNHGWGLAIDSAIFKDGRILGITSDPKVWKWLQDNAVSFGFSWEGAKPGQPGWEPWHIRYVAGDKTPQRILDIEAWFAAASAGAK